MAYRQEHLEGLTTDPLCRRIGRSQFGVSRFKIMQLAKQTVILRVRNQRRIEDVILMIMPLDLGP